MSEKHLIYESAQGPKCSNLLLGLTVRRIEKPFDQVGCTAEFVRNFLIQNFDFLILNALFWLYKLFFCNLRPLQTKNLSVQDTGPDSWD